MADSYKQNHITKTSKSSRTPDSHPVQVPKSGFDASKGGVSAGTRHSAGGSLPKGKTNMTTGAVKGSKVGKANAPKRDSRSGVFGTTPMSPAAHGSGQGMSSDYKKAHK